MVGESSLQSTNVRANTVLTRENLRCYMAMGHGGL